MFWFCLFNENKVGIEVEIVNTIFTIAEGYNVVIWEVIKHLSQYACPEWVVVNNKGSFAVLKFHNFLFGMGKSINVPSINPL